MTESTVSERIAHRWYARPVLFVSDVQGALRFYIDKLGFEKRWHEADGKGKVCQVNLLMKLPGPLNADQEEQLHTVETSATHLLSLINDLLDLAKIESGKVE
jgi:signal transduction histidine kinase